MRENLRLTVRTDDTKECFDLLKSLGRVGIKTMVEGGARSIVEGHFNLDSAIRTITLDELRELARPKEYLTSDFKLVLTNQPESGWILVPEGAEWYAIQCRENEPNDSSFYKSGDKRLSFWMDGQWNGSFLSKPNFHRLIWQRKETKMTSKTSRFLHQEWIQKYIDGADIQKRNISMKNYENAWYDLDRENEFFIEYFTDDSIEFRLKPRTIQIGSHTINAPIDVKPELGERYYISCGSAIDKYCTDKWAGDEYDNEMFSRNLCHLTQLDAENHTDALLALMELK